MNIAEALAATPVTDVDLARHVVVTPLDSVAHAVAEMAAAGRSCACVVDGGELVGIFTQRDVLMRAIGRPATWDRPIAEEMTRRVRTMGSGDSVADGLAIMNDWWVRSVPVLDGDRALIGSLSYYVVMKAIADRVGALAAGNAPGVAVEHGLAYVDFTGLPTSRPVTVGAADGVDVAAHHMQARAIGSVLVVDDREHLVGMLTEFDLLTQVGCRHPDPALLAVKDVMTPHPVALSIRSPIAEGIAEMAKREFSHVPLLGESGRPVGVASFRDVAAYFEASVAALG